jgi:hypothetical protein
LGRQDAGLTRVLAYDIERVETQDTNMTQITSRKVVCGEPIFPQQPRFSSAEITICR